MFQTYILFFPLFIKNVWIDLLDSFPLPYYWFGITSTTLPMTSPSDFGVYIGNIPLPLCENHRIWCDHSNLESYKHVRKWFWVRLILTKTFFFKYLSWNIWLNCSDYGTFQKLLIVICCTGLMQHSTEINDDRQTSVMSFGNKPFPYKHTHEGPV